MLFEPEFWVAVGFVVLIVAIAKPAAKAMTGGLDKRAARIRETLDEARSLAEEAGRMLAENQRKSREAASEVERLVAHAREEGERIVADSRAKLDVALARREQLARDKIAMAEAEALREVRELSVDVAIAAARALIAAKLDRAASDRLIDSSIDELPARLH
jgi:F-type H+-transporting ATPase subunit b